MGTVAASPLCARHSQVPDSMECNRIELMETRVMGLVHGKNSQAALGKRQALHGAIWEMEKSGS